MALPLMARNGLPANPLNYAIWYEYVSGRTPELNKTVDDLLGADQPPAPEAYRSLYQRYIADGDEAAIEEMRLGVRHLLAGALSQLTESGGQAMHYGRVLETYSNTLNKKIDLDEMRKVINFLITETKTMEYSNTLLEERLKNTTRDLERIRKELEHAKHEATTDALTAIANRKAFDNALNSWTAEAAENGKPLCLLIADIDHFKKFNDTHGHLLGDKLIRFVARSLKNSVKGGDLVARYGGEEFAILLPNTPYDGAKTAAEHIRATVESQRLRKTESKESVGNVTLSVGVALYIPGEPLEAFVQRADAALYQAKHLGRNRVVGQDMLRQVL